MSEPARGTFPQQVVLSWMLAQADAVVPIPGASRPPSLRPQTIKITRDRTPRRSSTTPRTPAQKSEDPLSSGSCLRKIGAMVGKVP